MKLVKIGLTVTLLASNLLLADALQLIGVDKKGSHNISEMDLTGVKSIQEFKDGSLKAFDPALPSSIWASVQPFTTLDAGKGYWVILEDSYADKTFIFSGESIDNSDINFVKDSNLHLVTFPQTNDISESLTFINSSGYSIKSIQGFKDGSLKAFDPALPSAIWSSVQPFTTLDAGKGYWVITDGYTVPSNAETNTTLENPPSTPDLNTTDTTDDSIGLPPQVPSV